MRALVGVVGLSFVLAAGAFAARPDRAPPRLLAAGTGGTSVTLSADEKLASTRTPVRAFVVVVNGRSAVPLTARVTGRRVVLTLPDAVRGDDLVRVNYTPWRVAARLRLRDAAGNLARGVSLEAANRSAAGCTERLGPTNVGGASEGPTDSHFYPAGVGPLRITIVQVSLPDKPPATTPPAVPVVLDSMLRELSYGHASVATTIAPGSVLLPAKSTDYDLAHDNRRFFSDVVRAADASVDFSSTDVVMVSLPPRAGLGFGSTRSTFVATPGTGVTADGNELRFFFTGAADATGVRTLLQFLGLPDWLGRYQQLGFWDAMSYAAANVGGPPILGLLAWHRWKLGWLDPTQIRCLQPQTRDLDVTLTPLWRSGGVKAIVLPVTRTTAVVAELRERRGLDSYLCGGGILVYRVDSSPTSSAAIQIFPAKDDATVNSCGILHDAAYDIGAGPVSAFLGFGRLELLERLADGSVRVRVSR